MLEPIYSRNLPFATMYKLRPGTLEEAKQLIKKDGLDNVILADNLPNGSKDYYVGVSWRPTKYRKGDLLNSLELVDFRRLQVLDVDKETYADPNENRPGPRVIGGLVGILAGFAIAFKTQNPAWFIGAFVLGFLGAAAGILLFDPSVRLKKMPPADKDRLDPIAEKVYSETVRQY